MIERIIIENYKSIREMDLELMPINILIGANGAGKSNFISFFELAKQVYSGNIKEYSADRVNNLLHGGLKGSEFIDGLLDFDNTNAYSFRLVPGNHYDSLRVHRSGDYWNQFATTTKNYSREWNWKPMDYPGRQQRDWYISLYLNSFRVYHFHDTSDTSAMKQSGPLDDNRYLRENAGNLAAFLYLLQEKHPKNFRRIEMAVRSIAPFFERFDLKPLERLRGTEKIKLEWKEKGSDMYLDAFSLSDGTLRFIALTALLMQPEPPNTIIIDEPELGLHPFAIHKLAAMIQKASVKSQAIISTQSVEFVNQFNPEDVLTVDREEGQSVFHRLQKSQLEHWLHEFSLGEIWQKNVIGGQP